MQYTESRAKWRRRNFPAWLDETGIRATRVTAVTAEEWVPPAADDDGRRRRKRTDIVVRVITADGPRLIRVEAKIDAAVDPRQLAAAVQTADAVISLVPADVAPAQIPGAITITWERTLAVLREHPDADKVSRFLAEHLELVIDSPRVRSRRLAKLITADVLHDLELNGWTFEVSSGLSGSPLLQLHGPYDDTNHSVRIESSDFEYGRRIPLQATVMVSSLSSNTDPVVFQVIAAAADRWTPQALPEVVCGTHGAMAKRTPEEKDAFTAYGIPLTWTYGYGAKQLADAGWSGFGIRLKARNGDEQALLSRAVEIAIDVDRRLRGDAVDGGTESVSAIGEGATHRS